MKQPPKSHSDSVWEVVILPLMVKMFSADPVFLHFFVFNALYAQTIPIAVGQGLAPAAKAYGRAA